MNDENREKMKACAERINAMSDDELDALVADDKCPYEPEHLLGEPLGMFHCPLCGEMVLAGLPHPRQADLESALEELENLSDGVELSDGEGV